jgi:hypothetical protein
MFGSFSVVKHEAAHLPAKEITNKLLQNLLCVYENTFHLKLLNGVKVIIIIIIIIITIIIIKIIKHVN